MSDLVASTDPATTGTGRAERSTVRARETSVLSNLIAIGQRALTLALRSPAEIVPALMIPLFFFVVNIGTLQDLTQSVAPGFDYKAFQLPTAIVFAVTGVTRAGSLVNDINSGYFDRLLMTPVRRITLLLGFMAADFAVVMALTIPVIVLGFAVGVTFETGILGVLFFILTAATWGLAFTGFPYAIALKTGSAAAVNSSFLLFFPFAFLTTSSVPKEAMTGWLATAATYNPMTYLLSALRSLITDGWNLTELAKGWAAILGVLVLSLSMAVASLRGRVARG